MAEISGLEFEKQSDRLFIHFDVDEHFLKLDTFMRTADSARRIIEAIDGTFFQGSLEYELIVLPPQSGTFLSKLTLWVSGGAAAAFTFINSDVGSAYIESLTGEPPTYWARQLGEASRNIIESVSNFGEAENEADKASEQRTLSVLEDDEAVFNASARMVIAMTRGILEKETDQLVKIGMEIGELPNAVDARADFYLACIEDPEVKGIGFTPQDDFPIPRSSFPRRALKPERKETEDEPLPWEVSIESIYVTSPNWEYEDQKSRQWKGKDQNRRECYFIIEDAEFWGLVRRKQLRVDVLDNLKVQWAFQVIEGRLKNRRVLRVLEFNGDKLAEPLGPDAIRAILEDYGPLDSPRDERPSLFEW